MVVARFVDDPLFVCGSESVSDLDAELSRLAQRQRTPSQGFGEGLSFQELGNQIGSSLVSSHLKDREDVGMS